MYELPCIARDGRKTLDFEVLSMGMLCSESNIVDAIEFLVVEEPQEDFRT